MKSTTNEEKDAGKAEGISDDNHNRDEEVGGVAVPGHNNDASGHDNDDMPTKLLHDILKASSAHETADVVRRDPVDRKAITVTVGQPVPQDKGKAEAHDHDGEMPTKLLEDIVLGKTTEVETKDGKASGGLSSEASDPADSTSPPVPEAPGLTRHSNRRAPGVPGAYSVTTSAAPASSGTAMTSTEMGSTGDDETPVLATAFHVEDTQVEEEVRDRILREAVEADVVTVEDDNNKGRSNSMRWKALTGGLFLVVVLIVILVATGVFSGGGGEEGEDSEDSAVAGTNSINPNVPPGMTTMEAIRDRGYILCGANGFLPGYSYTNRTTGIPSGMNIDHCRALSLILFNSTENVEFVHATSDDRLLLLANGTVDILSGPTTRTMGRDVYDFEAHVGFMFSTPHTYTGLHFQGVPEFVECADRLDSFYGDCRDLQVCVLAGTTHEIILKDILPGPVVVTGLTFADLFKYLITGTCQVMANAGLPEGLLRAAGYTGAFARGTKMFSRDPLALVTRNDDPEWSNLVNLMLGVFFLAEAHNITTSNAHELYDLLAENSEDDDTIMELASTMEAMVAEFGNYGDIYEKHMAPNLSPRAGRNELYQVIHQDSSSNSGLLYSFPFGEVDAQGPEPLPGSTLDTILTREYLRCGVLSSRQPVFVQHNVNENNSTWSGFDVEFCRAVAASLFKGNADAVEFVELEDEDSAIQDYTTSNATLDLNGTEALVDVVAGARVTLLAAYQGRSFSTPYYYDNDSLDGYGLMTPQDRDPQWSHFIYWVVMAMIYAEENGVSQESLLQVMPVVNLFGESRLKQMLRDCVLALGSYGDVYNRTLEPLIPRAGANMLYPEDGGPLHFAFPFQ